MDQSHTPPSQPSAVNSGLIAEHARIFRDAIAQVCEGWTLPQSARKVLETALCAEPVAQQLPAHPDQLDAERRQAIDESLHRAQQRGLQKVIDRLNNDPAWFHTAPIIELDAIGKLLANFIQPERPVESVPSGDGVDLDDLEQAALAATPGPWDYNGNCRNGVWQPAGKCYVFETGCSADAVFTAKANPAAVLKLITLARRATAGTTAPDEAGRASAYQRGYMDGMSKGRRDAAEDSADAGPVPTSDLAGQLRWLASGTNGANGTLMRTAADALDGLSRTTLAPPQAFRGTISAGEYDRSTGMMFITVKLPFAGLPEQLLTINGDAVIGPAGAKAPAASGDLPDRANATGGQA